MPWREFTNTADLAVDPVPPSVREKAEDAAYANDFATLVATFRTDLEDLKRNHPSDRTRFAVMLQLLRGQILDGWGAPDAQFPQQAFEDHGPAILLRALAKAYEQPLHVMGELQCD